MFEEMGFKIDHSSTLYKRFRLKVLGRLLTLFLLPHSLFSIKIGEWLFFNTCINVPCTLRFDIDNRNFFQLS